MKAIKNYLVMLLLTMQLGSYGVRTSLISNHNQNSTEVQLNGNNFKEIDSVSDSNKYSYCFGLGKPMW